MIRRVSPAGALVSDWEPRRAKDARVTVPGGSAWDSRSVTPLSSASVPGPRLQPAAARIRNTVTRARMSASHERQREHEREHHRVHEIDEERAGERDDQVALR